VGGRGADWAVTLLHQLRDLLRLKFARLLLDLRIPNLLRYLSTERTGYRVSCMLLSENDDVSLDGYGELTAEPASEASWRLPVRAETCSDVSEIEEINKNFIVIYGHHNKVLLDG
jgi:hypothetical protein